MSFTKNAWDIFSQVISDYHQQDNVDSTLENPFEQNSLDAILYTKCWIDTVQWHLEDIIRDENIDATKALEIKRRIDSSNQKRTDMVESIDDYFQTKYKHTNAKENARLNTETPAWAIDRLSILSLKVFHMKQETQRANASLEHKQKCQQKLEVLLLQKQDLSLAIDELLSDIENGYVIFKTYRQMKMYNDESLNPVLYQKKNVSP